MKGLLIAYSFHPQKSVGALRPTYWAEECANSTELTFDVVTAVDGPSKGFQRYFVPLKSKSIWSFAIQDEGLRWSKDLMQFFKSTDLSKYNFVVFTGGPFFHFHTAKYLKTFDLKVYFDFRDPFSYNPRFKDRGLKKMVKQWYERRILKSADAVITVNDACHSYIGPEVNVTRWIVPNGFDERNLPETHVETIPGKLFYGGKFYWVPEHFFEAVNETGASLQHAGMPPFFEHPFLSSDAYNHLGMLSQKELYIQLQSCEIGVVFTMDVPFESTTKIYDYMALGKKILVVTQGEPNVGVLKRELDGYPGYKWVRNNKMEILEALEALKTMPEFSFDAHEFSRNNGLKVLTKHIQEDV